ncbi:zinc-ribbon domain-containing protein [Nocardioides alcanivorans]|uniref:zinc-ribbon domain-containing protein n=1 Tax=Nocardioides alcanivorans TaxID=2897352 RepID=UPI001F479988|nr:zinc-ribbon domain-containing protein [Nocardioides alcanivorans]
MNFCTSCGRPREAGDAFCAHCGAPTTVAGAGHSVGVLDPQPVPPEGGGGRRNAGVIWAIVGTVVLALGIGGFAVWKVFFATSSGADSLTRQCARCWLQPRTRTRLPRSA